jgi:hypothetical protein
MDQTERITALKRVPIFAELPQARSRLRGACKWTGAAKRLRHCKFGGVPSHQGCVRVQRLDKILDRI